MRTGAEAIGRRIAGWANRPVWRRLNDVPQQIWDVLAQPLAAEQRLPGITRLLYLVWLIRPDLQQTFDLDEVAGGEGFAAWAALHGPSEYPGLRGVAADIEGASRKLPADVAWPVPISTFMRGLLILRSDLAGSFSLQDEAGRTSYLLWYLRNRRAELGLHHPLPAWQAEALEETWIAGSADRMPLPQLARLLLTARPDLRAEFDVETPAGRDGYRHWFLLNGLRELDWFSQGSDAYRAWLATRLESGASRAAHFVRSEREDLQAAFPPGPDSTDLMAWARIHAGIEHGMPPELFQDGPQAHDEKSGAPRPLYPRGVNLVGYPRGVLGIGEDVRSAARALAAAGVPYCILDFTLAADAIPSDDELECRFVDRPVYDTNLFCMTAPEHARAVLTFGRDLVDGRHNIGYWPWELAEWPAEWCALFDLVDEIWASSGHTRRALDIVAPVPVVEMPMAVVLGGVPTRSRAEFGLDEGRFLFVFSFDANSYLTRKNPMAVLDAFSRAFPGEEAVGLVIKVMRPKPGGGAWAALRSRADRDPRVRVIDRTLDRRSILALYQACDCFVSLHRAEGFGRGLAEAMLLGKPVIATGWSGNTDFTRPDTALLVDYHLVPVRPGQYPLAEGMVWAEPSIAAAAACMRRVAADAAHGSGIAERGRALVAERHAPEAVGARYRARMALRCGE